ncbi:MAG TPA: DNA-binding protein [Nitrospirota bacterium]|nr:DNA-binding protein [Nitrospirota bacterium]
MTRKKLILFGFLFLLFVTSPLYSADTISPEEAINHIGQPATVCGIVASTRFATKSKGQPIFLYLDKPYPDHIFTIIIWGSDRSSFPNVPEVYYKNKRICVSGQIQLYNGKPEITARRSSQIKEER